MEIEQIEADYLVIGAGASAMAFVDAMLAESDATFVMVDRRHAPGGHWNDAYPFVRLHQPSSYYGVASKPLGRDRIEEDGFNKGFRELATGTEVTNYFHKLMTDVFLPSGRVQFFPLSDASADANGSGEITSLLSGERRRVKINKKLVDATLLNTNIPLTHKRQFAVADDVVCVPPNDLPRRAPSHAHFAVLGAGKTAIDAVCWLLENGAAPESISWVLPRDPWLINRMQSQPGLEFFERAVGGVATQVEIAATAKTIDDLCERMNAEKLWLRLSDDVWPTMIHGATITELELEQLKRVPNTIRKGRVKALEPGRIVLDEGEAWVPANALFVDCTARALASIANGATPIFGSEKISLQMVRQYQPTFSAALIGHIEARIDDEAHKRRLTQVAPMTDTVEDWVKMQVISMTNQYMWSHDEAVIEWIVGCRLDPFLKTMRTVTEDDQVKFEIMRRMRENAPLAAQNLQRLAQQADGAAALAQPA
ncbi:MAG: NAD(P)/FAD-dependent oxidoreductase [Maricaulaceae bacterium]